MRASVIFEFLFGLKKQNLDILLVVPLDIFMCISEYASSQFLLFGMSDIGGGFPRLGEVREVRLV